MTKIYIAENCEVTEHELIKETVKSFIIKHRGGVNGRYVQSKKKYACYINTVNGMNYINTIFATTDKDEAVKMAFM